MAKKIGDSGFSEKFQSKPKRLIENDGSINVKRLGGLPKNL